MADFVGAQYTIDEVNKNTDSKTAILTDATNGLAAIKTAEGTIDGRLTDGTNGLSAIKAAVNTANGYLTNGTYGLNAIKTAATNAQLSVKSVQRGTASPPYHDNVDSYSGIDYGPVNISSVNTSKSIALAWNLSGPCIIVFNSSSQIYLSSTSRATIVWQVIEFY